MLSNFYANDLVPSVIFGGARPPYAYMGGGDGESVVVSFPSSLVGFLGFHPYMCLCFHSENVFVTCFMFMPSYLESLQSPISLNLS